MLLVRLQSDIEQGIASGNSSSGQDTVIVDKDEESFRIITINTWKGDGNYDWRMQMMARELYVLEPDVICLQESVQTVDFQIDTADYLAEVLDMDMIYAPARLKQRSIERFEFHCHSGLAILSATPIDCQWLTSIPISEDDPERMALSGQMCRGDQLITITNLHLTHVSDKDGLRRQQLNTIIGENVNVAKNSYWFCCGDCNCSIEMATLAALGRENNVQIRDCYLAGGGLLPGKTLVGTDRPAAESRIDYIFFVQDQHQRELAFRNARVVLDTPDFEGCYPSDHFGVCVDIQFFS